MATRILHITALLLIIKFSFCQMPTGVKDPLTDIRPSVNEFKYNSKIEVKRVDVVRKQYVSDSITDSILYYSLALNRSGDTCKFSFFDIKDSSNVKVVKKKRISGTKVSTYKNNDLLFWNKYDKGDSLVLSKPLMYKHKVRYCRDRKGELLNIKYKTDFKHVDFFTYDDEGNLKSRGYLGSNKDTSFIVSYAYNEKKYLAEEKREYKSPEQRKVSILYKYDSLGHCINKLWWELGVDYAVEFYNDTIDYYNNCFAVKHKDFDRLNGSLINQSYYEQNNDELLIQYCNFNNQCYHFEYNDSLKLLNYYISDANDSIISSKTFIYEAGYLVKEINLLDKRDFTVWEYDTKGKLTKETNYENNVKTQEVIYTYNELNLLLEKIVIDYSKKDFETLVYNFEYKC